MPFDHSDEADLHPDASATAAYRRYLQQVDPLADDVAAAFAELPAGRGRQMLDTALASGIDAIGDPPSALVKLFNELDAPPIWVDFERLDRGGSLFMRSGAAGMTILGLVCLPMMYSSPGGNKPLVFTGQLLRRAPRRLAETARFMLETSRSGGLRRDAEGFRLTVKVRLMHAQVRRLLWKSGRWDPSWGEPVNQMYLAGTSLALSVVFVDGLRRLGLRVGVRDAEDLIALWRYSSHLMGVDPQLQCSTETQGWRIVELVRRCEGAPDGDSVALIHAVMNASYVPAFDCHAWRIPLAYDWSRSLLGDASADALGYPPRKGWQWVRHAARPLVSTADLLLHATPSGRALSARFGAALWDRATTEILSGKHPPAATASRGAVKETA